MRLSTTALLFSSALAWAACSADRLVPGVAGADEVSPTTISAGRTAPDGVNNASVYQFRPINISGQPVDLRQYRGRKILIVNTASRCAYTPQYTDLQRLHQIYGSRVVVLGFPCNQFGGQEPGADSTIVTFCTNNYGVTFPLFSRLNVRGTAADPLFAFLADRSRNGYTSQAPTWNFCKYLIDEEGYVTGYYPSTVNPMSPTIVNAVLRRRGQPSSSSDIDPLAP